MTKSTKQKAAELKAEQKNNYDDLNKKIAQMKNPTKRDVDYLQGIMKGKKYNRANRNELTDKLNEMEGSLRKTAEPSKSAVTFETPEPTKKGKKIVDIVKKANKLTTAEVMGTDEPVNAAMSERAKMFTEVRNDLEELAEKSLTYSRQSSGGTALRLAQTASVLRGLIKQKLRS